MNSCKLKWDLINPYIQNFPKIRFFVYAINSIFELVNWNMSIYRLFKISLIIPWCCKLFEFDFRVLVE